ncbi:hypothetical protein J4205_02735 [Candidatus Pacearchaeota archaeon]|nr:hypothetical protein [Candidatus Pacearchaeota archaeon]
MKLEVELVMFPITFPVILFDKKNMPPNKPIIAVVDMIKGTIEVRLFFFFL